MNLGPLAREPLTTRPVAYARTASSATRRATNRTIAIDQKTVPTAPIAFREGGDDTYGAPTGSPQNGQTYPANPPPHRGQMNAGMLASNPHVWQKRPVRMVPQRGHIMTNIQQLGALF